MTTLRFSLPTNGNCNWHLIYRCYPKELFDPVCTIANKGPEVPIHVKMRGRLKGRSINNQHQTRNHYRHCLTFFHVFTSYRDYDLKRIRPEWTQTREFGIFRFFKRSKDSRSPRMLVPPNRSVLGSLTYSGRFYMRKILHLCSAQWHSSYDLQCFTPYFATLKFCHLAHSIDSIPHSDSWRTG